MASLRITEFGGTMMEIGGRASAPLWPALAHQNVTIGAETDSAAFNASTRLIRVQAEALCCISIGPGTQTATTDMCRMTAGMTEYFGVSPGDKVSVITTT